MSEPFQNPSYASPITVPGKGSRHPAMTYTNYYSMAPPEFGDDSLSSSASGVLSCSSNGFTPGSPSCCGGSGGSGRVFSHDRDGAQSASGIDFEDFMQDRFCSSFNPLPLDRGMAVQAQTSGKLNAKRRELLDLQKQAQVRLAKIRQRFHDGMGDAREARADLEWTQKKLSSLQAKAARKHPKEYRKARERYPSPEY